MLKPIVFLNALPAPAKVLTPTLRTLPRMGSIPVFQTQLTNKPTTLLEIPETDENVPRPLRGATMNVLPGSHRPLHLPSLDLSNLAYQPPSDHPAYHGLTRTRTMLDLGVSVLTPRAPQTAREPSLLL